MPQSGPSDTAVALLLEEIEMEADCYDSAHQAYEHIDELIKSFNKLLGVSKILAGMLGNQSMRQESFEHNMQQARNLIAVSEEAVRQKNRVIDSITRYYQSNCSLKIWERMLSRFNNSLSVAGREQLSPGILDEQNALDQLFNRIASQNILSTRKLFRSIYQVELQVRDRQVRERQPRMNICRNSGVEPTGGNIESLIYFQRMRKMNEMALMPESAADTMNRLELLNVDYNATLEKNMQNIYENMKARNSIIKESIDDYAREHRIHSLKGPETDNGQKQESDSQVQRNLVVRKVGHKLTHRISAGSLEFLFSDEYKQPNCSRQAQTEASQLETMPTMLPTVLEQSTTNTLNAAKSLNGGPTKQLSKSYERLRRITNKKAELEFQMNAIASLMQSSLVRHTRIRRKKPYQNVMKSIDPSEQAFGRNGNRNTLSKDRIYQNKIHHPDTIGQTREKSKQNSRKELSTCTSLSFKQDRPTNNRNQHSDLDPFLVVRNNIDSGTLIIPSNKGFLRYNQFIVATEYSDDMSPSKKIFV